MIPFEQTAVKTEPSITKSLVRKILEEPLDYEWSVQGLGMMRLYLDDKRRLHIWDSSLAIDDVSSMHTHPWNFTSYVVAGIINNQRFIETDTYGGSAVEYTKQSLFCGVGGGLEGSPKKVNLLSLGMETYVEKETYHELAHEIHISSPLSGTVTIVKREVIGDPDHAFVYWGHGDWVSAEPRLATDEEISRVTLDSLDRWF